ncbi:MAG: hypothetical protein ACTHK7_21910 [Aureliella sp.]
MRAGRECTANLNLSPGTYAAPTWSTMGRITGVKAPRSRSSNERMYRGANNKKTILGYKSYGFSCTYLVKKPGSTDAILDALIDSFDNGTVLDFAILDGAPTTGAEGIRGPFVVQQMDRDEPDEDAVTYDLVLVEVDAEQGGTLWETDAYTVV